MSDREWPEPDAEWTWPRMPETLAGLLGLLESANRVEIDPDSLSLIYIREPEERQ